MSCDICGRRIFGRPSLVVVEGAKVTTCVECAALGKPFRDLSPPRQVATRTNQGRFSSAGMQVQKPSASLPKYVEEYELADNCSELIKKARIKHGLSQEELSIRVKEKVSMIQKIELGKMVPNTRLSRELEHVLRIKLLLPSKEPVAIHLPQSSGAEPTLGDVARIREKKAQLKG